MCVVCYKKMISSVDYLWIVFSLLPMSHDYYEKEFPDDRARENMNNAIHLYDGKDVIVETIRKNDNLRCRTRSSKVNKSACRIINFTTPMELVFEHTRASGARGSEKKIVQ